MRHLFFCIGFLTCFALSSYAQFNTRGISGGGGGGGMRRDTTSHQHDPDTLTLRYKYLGEPTDFKLDSSINDFQKKFLGIPANYYTLGNLGNAAKNILFTPRMTGGFDAGFHAYDVYSHDHSDAKFFNTNRPYSELTYLIGSKQEQVIGLSHTQNRTEKFNFYFDYQKVNAPGYYRNQNTNHDTYTFTARYNTPNKRYNANLSYYLNKINGGENGGIVSTSYLSDPDYKQTRTIPTNLGGANIQSSSFFNSTIPTKSQYQEASILYQHSYDWGKGDTIHINDTTDYWRYQPRFRIQHTFSYTQNTYGFQDASPDTTFYINHYGFKPSTAAGDTLRTKQTWKIMSNDVSLISFPQLGNLGHFLKVGATIDNIDGKMTDAIAQFYNFRLHGEYRNKTRNQKWDLQAMGEFYLLGANRGDYNVSGRLSRYLNERLGNISIMAKNVNQTPSYVYQFFSVNQAYWLNSSLNKENITQLQFAASNAKLRYSLYVNYFIYNNFTYFRDYQHSAQVNGIFNVLQVYVNKHFKVKSFNWMAEVAFQQIHGSSPVQLPTIWTRHRVGYDGTLYKNLNLFTGLEIKYNTAYYADDYSPLFGQFIYQDTLKISNKPDVAAFVNFRVKSFTAFVRGENLNALIWNPNMNGPLYPGNKFQFRLGIRWWFVN
ncbi:putative beta-barrel porin [Chitinophaga skermanii]|uniref:Putative beta-barrel porin n=1 Tax=Chitinophaga skermanii TaxID=331697 RepID=A0A327Q6N5_9BACT|nr:putative porin [Chitinophaga skermanii]RAI99421.1 putative beta-barrel porin [Chitinophaga skermanii]